ncbi:MAG TPA: glycosyltransferase family 39 protein [Roseiflexaceae bacterium]|nr:glycosyltransferase family 39 protein [Roseiflexaceae bacterium]
MSSRALSLPAAGALLRSGALWRFLLRHMAVALALWLLLGGALALLPALRGPDLRGVYAVEGEGRAFRWTSDLVTAPLAPRAGPTTVEVALAAGRWEGRPDQTVALLAGATPLAELPAPEQLRRYRLLLPPGVDTLSLRTPIHRPPGGDPRWLGVQLFELRAAPAGLPLPAPAATLPALLALSALGELCLRRGLVAPFAATLLALALRLLWLDRLPPGFFVDEVVSAVDAWHLAHTGRDHLGHLLPLGAFEAFGDWISPLLTYLELPFVALLGPTPLAARLATALVGALAVPAAYGLARELALPRAAATVAALVAALSPWQIFLSRVAIPPALVPLAVTLCMWAGLRLIRRGDRRSALVLAVAGGLGLYAYPTLKLMLPLLVALAALLAWRRHGAPFVRRAWPGALLAGLIWLPFLHTTLFNPYSNMRLSRKALQAETPAAWLGALAANYGSYFSGDFYYLLGDPGHQLPEAVELAIGAPLVLLGFAALLWCCVAPLRQPADPDRAAAAPVELWWFVVGAALLAPLPASLTSPNPHLFRGAIVAPVYALLVGLGFAVLWSALKRLRQPALGYGLRWGLALITAAGLLWQGGQWFGGYVRDYPRQMARAYQDGLYEAMLQAAVLAPQYDEVWVDGAMNQAPVYLLAADPLPPAEAQAQTVARTAIGRFTLIRRVGPYLFDVPALDDVPRDLPPLATALDQVGESAFVLQSWQHEGRRVLLVRRMWRW